MGDSPGVDGGLDVLGAIVSSREVGIVGSAQQNDIANAVRSSAGKGYLMVKLQVGPRLTAATGLGVDKATLAAIALIDLPANRCGDGAGP